MNNFVYNYLEFVVQLLCALNMRVIKVSGKEFNSDRLRGSINRRLNFFKYESGGGGILEYLYIRESCLPAPACQTHCLFATGSDNISVHAA